MVPYLVYMNISVCVCVCGETEKEKEITGVHFPTFIRYVITPK